MWASLALSGTSNSKESWELEIGVPSSDALFVEKASVSLTSEAHSGGLSRSQLTFIEHLPAWHLVLGANAL